MTTKPIHTEQQVYDYSKEAIKELQLKVDPECFLNDIVKITCLVLKDVDQYRFIHKTVQEYFAASMVHRKPESWARDFYFKMVDSGCRGFWNQELAFLNEIDKFRYNKYFLVPSLCKLIGVAKKHLNDVKINITSDIIKEKLSQVELGLRIDHGKGNVCRITLANSLWPYNDKFTSRLFRINFTPVVSAILTNKIRYRTAEREAYINDGSGRAKVYVVKLQDILNSGYLLSEITDLLTDIFTLAKKTAIAANEFVEKEEIDRSLLDAVFL
jgi:hypothetical protein